MLWQIPWFNMTVSWQFIYQSRRSVFADSLFETAVSTIFFFEIDDSFVTTMQPLLHSNVVILFLNSPVTALWLFREQFVNSPVTIIVEHCSDIGNYKVRVP